MGRPTDDRELWTRWLQEASAEVGVSLDDIPVDPLLDLAAVVAVDVARPMAPVTAFVAGLAAGRGTDPVAATEALTELARDWDDEAQA